MINNFQQEDDFMGDDDEESDLMSSNISLSKKSMI